MQNLNKSCVTFMAWLHERVSSGLSTSIVCLVMTDKTNSCYTDLTTGTAKGNAVAGSGEVATQLSLLSLLFKGVSTGYFREITECIRWQHYRSELLGFWKISSSLTAITTRPTLTQCSCFCKNPINSSNCSSAYENGSSTTS